MKTLKKHWSKFAVASSALLALTLLFAGLLWGQTAPGLRIAVASSNQVSLTVINGTTNGLYQIYFTEFLDPDEPDWTLLANGTIGQTNFSADMQDFEHAYFKAVNNTNFVPPSITIIIQGPADGSVVY